MAPPKFADIGKAARDLLGDSFPVGKKLTLKTKSNNGVDFKVEGTNVQGKGVKAFIETKFNHSSGVSVKEKWNTDNVVSTEFKVPNKPIKGLTLSLNSDCSPAAGLLGLALKGDFKNKQIATDFKATSSGAATVAGTFAFKDWVVGASGSFKGSGGPISTALAVGYSKDDLQVSTSVVNGSDVKGSIFRKANNDVDVGVCFSWNRTSNESDIAVGCKAKLDADTVVKAKIDKSLVLGLSYSQTLRKGVTFCLSATTNTNRLASDDHKLGAHLTLSA